MPVSKLNKKSRDILGFRPSIHFIQPDVISESPSSLVATIASDNLDAALKDKKTARALADAVEKLALATQIRIDERARLAKIELDKDIDLMVIQALRREFPERNPYEIEYDEYKTCKDKLTKNAEDMAKKMLMSQDKVDAAANSPLYKIGGFGTSKNSNGKCFI